VPSCDARLPTLLLSQKAPKKLQCFYLNWCFRLQSTVRTIDVNVDSVLVDSVRRKTGKIRFVRFHLETGACVVRTTSRMEEALPNY
jgi:hypothetical protein